MNMPTKKTKLTANNLKQRPGWFPPIHDKPGTYGHIYGKEEFYKNDKAGKEYFHKIMKENFGFSLVADPEDVKKRIVLTSDVDRAAMDKYLRRMEEVSQMPDSPQKIEEYNAAAGEMEFNLYQMLSKGRLVFIPLGETEPRQLRFNPDAGEFQLSGEYKNLEEFSKLNDAFLPRDKRGNIITQKKENLLQPQHPGEFTLREPVKPQPLQPFKETLRDMPKMREVKPLRDEPKPPKDPREGGKTKDDLIEEEFKELTKGMVKPELKEVDIPVPRFTFKVPEKIEKPNPPRTDLKEPVAPAIENEIKLLEEQMKSVKDPVFNSEFKRVLVKKPVPVKEPYKPVLESPDPPVEPEYIQLQKEPVFKHPLLPDIKLRYPDWKPREKPVHPGKVQFIDPPDEPRLREEPQEPQRPGFFRRLFSSAANRQYEERHRVWEEDHNNWVRERDELPQRMNEYRTRASEVERQNTVAINDYIAKVQAYTAELELYNAEMKEYEHQLQDLEPENQMIYDQFMSDLQEYKEARAKLGDQYDLDYQDFLTEHKLWEEQNKEDIEKNKKIKEDYENSPEYKKYEEEKNWYDVNVKPYVFQYDKIQGIKDNLTKEYEENLAKYNAYLKDEEAYQKALEPVKEWIEEDDRVKNGGKEDYEENKESRLSERLAANEKANLDYDKELEDYKNKMESLYDVHKDLINKPEHIQYVKDKKEYDRNEELKTKKVVVKKQVPDDLGFDLNVNYDELTDEEKKKLGEKLDPILTSDKQPLLSEKVVEDENNEKVIENDNFDALNYSVVEDELFDGMDEEGLQQEGNQEEKQQELGEDQEEITLYEYELRRFEASQKDQKYYDLMKKRYDDKVKEFEQKKEETEEWNVMLDFKVTEYDNRIQELQMTAQNNVSQKLRTYDENQVRYEKDHEKWKEEEKEYKEDKADAERDYSLAMFNWNNEKEAFDNKKAEYEQEAKDYENYVNAYNTRVKEYKAAYEDYSKKLIQYNNDVKMNKIIEEKNEKYEEEYQKLVEENTQKKIAKDPELLDYKRSQQEYLNGSLQWGLELNKNATVSEWKNDMKSEQVMDQYFDNHQRKINEYNNFKIKCKNIKEVDPIQQKNYEEMIKYGKYPEKARPFFKLLDLEEEKLDKVIDHMGQKDFESADNFRDAATLMMYNKVVRNELESTYKNPDFDPNKFAQYLDPKYKSDALKSMRSDKTLVASLKTMHKQELNMAIKIKQDVPERFRNLFKADSWKVTDLYSKRYENLKKDAIDPITKKTHKAKTAENNKSKPEKKPVKMFS